MTPRSRQLAGVRFVDMPPVLPEKLPRMDIAVFVGLASAGPLHTPVALEDPTQFGRIFGDDLHLAWDGAAGESVSSYLGPAIRAFFRNGGRRCWVIRVGGIPRRDGTDSAESAPEANVFPLRGLMRLVADDLQPAFAYARSPGTWFDTIRSATALITQPLNLLSWSSQEIEIGGAAQPPVRAGDLLRLLSSDNRLEAFLAVKSVVALPSSPPSSRPDRYTVYTSPLGSVRWLPHDTFADGEPITVSWQRRPAQMEQATAHGLRPRTSPSNGSTESRLSVSPDFSPPPGALLRLTNGPSPRFFLVDRVEAKPAFGSPPSDSSEMIGRAFEFSVALPRVAQLKAPRAERLSFELQVRRGQSESNRLPDLGFAPEHPRYWNALPDDRTVFETTESQGSMVPVATNEHRNFVVEASNPRFPLAGDNRSACFLPIGMTPLLDPWMAAEHSGRATLKREGLESFSSALFLDPRLQGSVTGTLLSDADFLRYQLRDAPRLRGIHAALSIEEATLIAVPDATHRRWQAAKADPPAVPRSSAAVAHPHWWHFLPCNPAASPPENVEGPDYGHFLACGLGILAKPSIAVEGPDPSGTYQVRWATSDPEVEFILEEATRADFLDAVARPRTSDTQHTFLARVSGTYYHRVRAEAQGESSNWSDGVVVHVGIAERWELERLTEFQDVTLLEVHRALLRVCAARADLVAVLALPGHWRDDSTLEYANSLKSGSRITNDVLPIGPGEDRALSYGAVYHPWILARDTEASVVRRPPDGTMAGVIARRSIARGAWIAPANEPLTGVFGLSPRIDPERQLDLLVAQVNLIRHEPHGVLVLSADTLSDDPDLRPLNVRRLLILLRRAALRLGNTYVFEPNDATLRRMVRGAFESLLQRLFMRGAFAGATADASYRVGLEDSVNAVQTMERGQFFVELKVAPALPLSFLTIRLVQIGERATAVESI
jgi:hypothetical protein